MPTSATSNPLPEATVIAVGPGAPNKDGKVVPTQVKAGDHVLLPGWGGNSIKVGEEVCSTHVSCWFIPLTLFSFVGVLPLQRFGDPRQNQRVSFQMTLGRGDTFVTPKVIQLYHTNYFLALPLHCFIHTFKSIPTHPIHSSPPIFGHFGSRLKIKVLS